MGLPDHVNKDEVNQQTGQQCGTNLKEPVSLVYFPTSLSRKVVQHLVHIEALRGRK